MIKRIDDGSELRIEFQKIHRDDYSITAYDTILEIMDEINPDTELDVYALRGSFTEYSAEELIEEFGDYYTEEEYRDDYLYEEDDIDENEYLDALVSKLQKDYYLVRIGYKDYLLMQ